VVGGRGEKKKTKREIGNMGGIEGGGRRWGLKSRNQKMEWMRRI